MSSFFMACSSPSRLITSPHTPRGPPLAHKGERIKSSYASPVLGFPFWVLQLKQHKYFVISTNSNKSKFLSDPHGGMPSQRIYRRKLCSDSFAIPLYIDDMGEKGLNRIDFLVQILHHSANSFTNAIQSHELAWEGAQLAKAWIGVDVHAWHKHLAYQAAVYALLQTAIGSWIRHYNDHERDHGLVQKIQNMLNICLEDYWVSYDGSTELQSIGGRETEEVSVGKHEILSSVTSIEEIQQNPIELRTEFELVSKCMAQFCEVSGGGRKDEAHSKKVPSAKESKVVSQRCITKYIEKLISTSLDVYIGTQLLFVDISVAVGFLWNQVCGQTLTRRERNKLRRTLADVASVIPVAIIMLLPLSAVGHAAIFAAIKKYAPGLIPSTYSSARLDVIKQLKRTKEMELQPLSNLEVSSL